MNRQQREDVLAGRVDMFEGLSYLTVGEVWQTVWVDFLFWLFLSVLVLFITYGADTATKTFGISDDLGLPIWLRFVVGASLASVDS